MVGLGVALVAPGLVGAVLPLLLVAACPLSMVLMMWGMRGMTGTRGDSCAVEPDKAPGRTGDATTRDGRIRELGSQLADTQARQEAIAEELARLEADEAGVQAMGRGDRSRVEAHR
jgi:hypothetical protein